MTASGVPTPEPPADRQTKFRWGCLLSLLLGGALVFGVNLLPSRRFRRSSARIVAGMQASGIAKALFLYAQDHDGKFPAAEKDSNEAFRQLFPDYLEGEKVFFVAGSAWHDDGPGKAPDDDIGVPPGYAKCLERGENHWAYVSGLNDKSRPTLPLIADGFIQGEPGSYTDDPTKSGGVWRGAGAVVVFADGSGRWLPVSPKPRFRVLPSNREEDKMKDLFAPANGLPAGARVLNPE